MSDHALRVYKRPTILTAVEAVLSFGEIALSAQENDKLRQYFKLNGRANLVNDTRAIECGDVFCAVIGTVRDGREFVQQALSADCAMVLVETLKPAEHGQLTWIVNANHVSVPVLSYYQLNEKLFAVAKAFYGMPEDKLNIIGITGTNGKTSTSQIIANLLDDCQRNCAVIGTTGAGKLAQLQAIENTTPGATQLQQLLALFAEESISDVAMEVSSHALSQKRVTTELFNTTVFTNLTRDHLDYHKTMAAYAAAKHEIFSGSAEQVAVLNGDDLQAQAWLKNWPNAQPVVVYGRDENIRHYSRFVQASNIRHHATGVSFELHTEQGQCQIHSQLLGDFNVENLLAAIAVLMVENIALNTISQAVSHLVPIIGRMEAFSAENKPTAVVDYAHTPDALSSALDACRLHCHGKLWVVFGCGGDRDTGKRVLMAQVAESKADRIIITNDNPRTENPDTIAQAIIAGLSTTDNAIKILDREQAVLTALSEADANDVILCAGKGHEDYIIFGNEKQHYDEREVVRSFYASSQSAKNEVEL
ncbi:UDP-N-acetylmuramoyl-L-alanyl-D-glutamate--2,6-diaminopimelate ligase [Cognaticolwellia mytili]|uniref:UDP-N-acetylmuramoyl-L-alanyl-D-glutamate--2, 6-diaminopimelate ligase n=1 Tax=Cognaticolwellia mytili TaxID=1888913 RepID=UPI000A173BD9|nr:UDP-N-acetylmuramoyl-L-alanyl-D-glutamate--2,6-diaminopimelate ligase [Cognaticolwellia mytili]